MDTVYNVYASFFNKKLEKGMEEKLLEGQFGFRAGKGIMDAVYVLNYITNAEITEK